MEQKLCTHSSSLQGDLYDKSKLHAYLEASWVLKGARWSSEPRFLHSIMLYQLSLFYIQLPVYVYLVVKVTLVPFCLLLLCFVVMFVVVGLLVGVVVILVEHQTANNIAGIFVSIIVSIFFFVALYCLLRLLLHFLV